MISYDLRSITHNQKPGQATINVICVGDIYDAVSLRNNCVRFFYYGQFKEHEIEFKILKFQLFIQALFQLPLWFVSLSVFYAE